MNQLVLERKSFEHTKSRSCPKSRRWNPIFSIWPKHLSWSDKITTKRLQRRQLCFQDSILNSIQFFELSSGFLISLCKLRNRLLWDRQIPKMEIRRPIWNLLQVLLDLFIVLADLSLIFFHLWKSKFLKSHLPGEFLWEGHSFPHSHRQGCLQNYLLRIK